MIHVKRVWITGCSQNGKGEGYLGSVSMDLEFGAVGQAQVRGMRLIEMPDGSRILAMPSRETVTGRQQMFRPLNRETEKVLTDAAIKEYERIEKGGF